MSRFSGNAVAADPAPLLLCAERNPEVVLRAVEQMLASASRGPTTALVGPDGQPLGPPGEMADFPGAADRPRSVAAVACLPLIEEMPGTAPRLVEALARSLESPDHDRYDAPPSRMVAMTLGQALLRRYADVAPPFLAVAHRISAEARKSLFEAVSSALHSRDESGTPDPLPQLVQLAIDRLQGDWGEEVATEAALTLRDQARFHPERLAGHADGLVGVLITEITSPAGSATGLVVPSDPLSGIEALGRRQRRESADQLPGKRHRPPGRGRRGRRGPRPVQPPGHRGQRQRRCDQRARRSHPPARQDRVPPGPPSRCRAEAVHGPASR